MAPFDPRLMLRRRTVLQAAGANVGLALVGPALLPEDRMKGQERDMVLEVAKAGAVYPAEPPSFGEEGTAASRATMDRLKGAESRLTRQRAVLVRKGAQALISEGLLEADLDRLLMGIGKAAGGSDKEAVIAAVQLAAATVSRHFDPNRDHPANMWVGLLDRMASDNVQPRPLRHIQERG